MASRAHALGSSLCAGLALMRRAWAW